MGLENFWMISNQLCQWHSVALNGCHFPSLTSSMRLCICLYISYKSTAQFSTAAAALYLSIYIFLSFHFTHFTHIPGHQLLKRCNLKTCLAYFMSPTCVLYPVLWCCWKDVSLTLPAWECLWLYWSVSIYLHNACASSLYLNPFGQLYLFTSKIQQDKLKPTVLQQEARIRASIKETSACMGFFNKSQKLLFRDINYSTLIFVFFCQLPMLRIYGLHIKIQNYK